MVHEADALKVHEADALKVHEADALKVLSHMVADALKVLSHMASSSPSPNTGFSGVSRPYSLINTDQEKTFLEHFQKTSRGPHS